MTKKISIKSLYKIFGKNPKRAMEHVQNGVGKDQLLEKHNHVLGLSDINLDIEDKIISKNPKDKTKVFKKKQLENKSNVIFLKPKSS